MTQGGGFVLRVFAGTSEFIMNGDTSFLIKALVAGSPSRSLQPVPVRLRTSSASTAAISVSASSADSPSPSRSGYRRS